MEEKLTTLRPGVYTRFVLSDRLGQAGTGARCALAAEGVPTQGGEPLLVTRRGEGETLLPGEGNALLRQMAEGMLAAGCSGVWCLPVEGSGESYVAAFAKLAQLEGVDLVCCDRGDSQTAGALKGSVLASSANGRERMGVTAVATAAAAISLAGELDCERMILCCGSGRVGEAESPALLAAAFSGYLAGQSSPAADLNGAAIPVLDALVRPLTEEEVEGLLAAGAIPFEQVGGRVECIRGVTTRTTTDGKADNTYRSINTVRIIDRVLMGLRASLARQLKGSRGGVQTREGILSQVLVELAARQEEGLLESYQTPTAQAHPQDPGLCVVELAFTVAQTVGQVLVTAQVQV